MAFPLDLSDKTEFIANELALLRNLGVDRRQLSWLALGKPIRRRKAPVTRMLKRSVIDRQALATVDAPKAAIAE
jgi:hypothetical protein